ncbi:MAG TPA: hypothetical protein VHC48_18830 [Puia sp.]|nr:hypothetical protein [Puia sp.]
MDADSLLLDSLLVRSSRTVWQNLLLSPYLPMLSGNSRMAGLNYCDLQGWLMPGAGVGK